MSASAASATAPEMNSEQINILLAGEKAQGLFNLFQTLFVPETIFLDVNPYLLFPTDAPKYAFVLTTIEEWKEMGSRYHASYTNTPIFALSTAVVDPTNELEIRKMPDFCEIAIKPSANPGRLFDLTEDVIRKYTGGTPVGDGQDIYRVFDSVIRNFLVYRNHLAGLYSCIHTVRRYVKNSTGYEASVEPVNVLFNKLVGAPVVVDLQARPETGMEGSLQQVLAVLERTAIKLDIDPVRIIGTQ